jgi:nitroreductase
MPELLEIIESTRAMRRLKPDPVPDELVRKILRAGVCAPRALIGRAALL